jgi:hypothetical protein
MVLSQKQRDAVERHFNQEMWRAYCENRIDVMLMLAANLKHLLATCR